MVQTPGTILVTGPTRGQGAAAASHLLADGWPVRAFTRDPSSPAARALADAGAEVVAGSMADRAALEAALTGVYGVFSVQPTAHGPNAGLDEVRLGVNVAEAAHAAGVRHLVYTSVGGVERGSGISFWETKWRIEQRIRALGLPATFLRPVQFMENYASPLFGLQTGTFTSFASDDRGIQVIAVDDIGAFAALAFARPEHYQGRALEIAGDQLTAPRIAEAIQRAIGRTVGYHRLEPETLSDIGPLAGAELADLRAAHAFATEKGGWQADIPALRALHPGLMDFGTWLARGGAAKIAELLTAQPA